MARAAFPKGCLAMRFLGELGVLFQDADFAAAFPTRGGPGLSPGMLALVSVMQFCRATDGPPGSGWAVHRVPFVLQRRSATAFPPVCLSFAPEAGCVSVSHQLPRPGRWAGAGG
ncbi:hypothetical protein GCM10009753_45710 [Streptantibioticus ferralitis]